jgi:hypothetical protein
MSVSREKETIPLDSHSNALESESKISVRPAEYDSETGVYKLLKGILYAQYLSRMFGIPDTR